MLHIRVWDFSLSTYSYIKKCLGQFAIAGYSQRYDEKYPVVCDARTDRQPVLPTRDRLLSSGSVRWS